jgi:hypothetical protein
VTSYTTRGYPYPDPLDPADLGAVTQAAVAQVDTDMSACLPALGVTTFGDFPGLAMVGTSTSTVGAANRCISVAFKPRSTITPTRIRWWCTVQNGNFDIGIVNATTRARMWSLGSTACPAVGVVTNNILVPPTLVAGTVYEMAFSADNNTLALRAVTLALNTLGVLYAGTNGVRYDAGAHPIPNPLPGANAGTVIPAIALLV